MRVINLDATGIKIITSDKKQMYLSLAEVRDFLDKKYKLTENILSVNNKKLILSDKDIDEFPSIVTYIEIILSGLFEKITDSKLRDTYIELWKELIFF